MKIVHLLLHYHIGKENNTLVTTKTVGPFYNGYLGNGIKVIAIIEKFHLILTGDNFQVACVLCLKGQCRELRMRAFALSR